MPLRASAGCLVLLAAAAAVSPAAAGAAGNADSPKAGDRASAEAAPRAVPAADSLTVWTAFPVPDGTTVYVRYGRPGGVHIASRPGGADTAAAPAAATAAPAAEPAPGAPAVEIDPVLRILREELERAGRLRAEAAETLSPSGAAPPAAAGTAGEGLVVVDRPAGGQGMAVAASDSAGSTPPQEVQPVADREPDIVPIPDVRVIREEFLDTGLFRTSLVLFETNRAGLLPPSRDVLRAVGRVLQEFPEARLRVEGHCDERGPAAFNLELSRRRADAVRDFLVDTMGIDAGRIEAVGYGEERPLVEGRSATALALNRRVEFRILNPESLERTGDDGR